jgi:hypothetical protein
MSETAYDKSLKVSSLGGRIEQLSSTMEIVKQQAADLFMKGLPGAEDWRLFYNQLDKLRKELKVNHNRAIEEYQAVRRESDLLEDLVELVRTSTAVDNEEIKALLKEYDEA